MATTYLFDDLALELKEKDSPDKKLFVYSVQTFRGPIHVRMGPTTTIYRIAIYEDPSKPDVVIESEYDLQYATSAVIGEARDPLLTHFSRSAVQVPPESDLNPTKETPSEITYLDQGSCEVLESSDTRWSFTFHGRVLVGPFEMKRKVGETVWEWYPVVEEAKAFTIISKNEEKRLVYGVALIPNKVDLQGDIVEVEEIEKAAHDYMIRSRNIDVMHSQNAECYVVESYIAPCDFVMNHQKVTKGSWVLVVKVLDDKVWQAVKAGELRGFSIYGTASVEPVEDSDGSSPGTDAA
jgi:hypothetical protein